MKKDLKKLFFGICAIGICTIAIINVGCNHKTATEQSLILAKEPETTVTLASSKLKDGKKTTATPSATTNVATKQRKYAHWDYDEKTHCLTISGNGETHDDAYARDGQGEWMFNNWDNKSDISGFDNEQWKDVTEVVIKQGVTAVNTAAFAGYTNLKKVTIPNSVKKMGAYVFYECESLKEIIIPDEVASIGKECFYGCKSLKKLVFGKKVRSIGEGNFAGCQSLRRISVRQGNKNLITRNGILYQKNKKILYFAYGTSRNVTIRKGTKKIGACAFFQNPQIRKVKIPASVTTIGGGAFYQCKNLKKVAFAKQSKCNIIKDYSWYWDGYGANYGCFLNCKKLKEMVFPEKLKFIGSDCFIGCTSLRKVYFGKSFEGYYGYVDDTPQTWFGEFIMDKSALKQIVVSKKNSHFSSENGVMFDKKKETLYIYPSGKTASQYVVPQSVNKIRWYAFRKCKKLKSIIIYGKNTKIDTNALSGSKHITLYGKKNSIIQKFAKKRKMKFVAI